MLESSTSCPNLDYYRIIHSLKGLTSLASQLNYIIDIVLELKAKLVKIKAEVKEIKKQLVITHLSLINEIRHSENFDLSLSTPFQHKYPFQNPKIENPFPVQDLKIKKKSKNLQKNHQKKN